MENRARRRSSARRLGIGLVAALTMAGAAVAGLVSGTREAAAASNAVTISPGPGGICLPVGLLCPAPTLNPATASTQSGQAVTWTNNTGVACTLNFDNHVPVQIGSATGSTAAATFTQPASYTASCGSLPTSAAASVAVTPAPTPTPAPATPTPVPGTPTATPGTTSGAGTAKPHVVAAATPKPTVSVIPGPQGSTALPPITDPVAPTPGPSLDPSSLPVISAPSAPAKPKATLAAGSPTSSRTKTFYIVGGIVFAAAVVIAAAIYGIRRWRRGAADNPSIDEGAYLI